MGSATERVRVLWRDLADAPNGFNDPLAVVKSDRHRAAPHGWIGIITIDTGTVITSPSRCFDRVRETIEAADPSRLGEHAYIASILHPAQTLGPAQLFYDITPRSDGLNSALGPLPITDQRVASVLRDATPEERDECGLEDSTSGVHLALDANGQPAAICGWSLWPHDVAHLGVLTARSSRGTGHAFAASSQAIRKATAVGLLVQWRAAERNEASIRLARSLGLSNAGSQFSLRLDD